MDREGTKCYSIVPLIMIKVLIILPQSTDGLEQPRVFFRCSPSHRFRGEKVPTLQEAVEECIKHKLVIYFDVKGHPDEVRSSVKQPVVFRIFYQLFTNGIF